MLADAAVISEFDVELYFALVEKMIVLEGGKLVVSLFDGTEVECENLNKPVGVAKCFGRLAFLNYTRN